LAIAPKEEKRNIPGLRMCLTYSLDGCSGIVYSGEAGDYLTFPEGRYELLARDTIVVDSLIQEVVFKHKEVAVVLTPPLAGLGFLSTELAPRGIEPLFGE
jgi:hypothetical protein